MSIPALQPNFIDGFASECVRLGLSEKMTEFFYKHAVFKQQAETGKFAAGFVGEFNKSAVKVPKVPNHWMGNVGQFFGNWMGRGTSTIAPIVSGLATGGSKALALAAKYPKTSLGLGVGGLYAGNKMLLQPWMKDRSNEEMFTRPTGISQYLPGGAAPQSATAAPSDPWNLIEGLNQTQPMSPSGGGTASSPTNFHAAYNDIAQKLNKAKTTNDYASQVELMKQKAMMEGTRKRLGEMRQYGSAKLPGLRDKTQQAIDEFGQQQSGERGNWWQFWQHKWSPEELDAMTSKVRALQDNQLLANRQLQG